MAEILAGLLTSAVVGIAKDKLAAAITEQANLLWNFGGDLGYMNSVLEAISAALQDAERRSAKEKLVELWLKRLKHAALDITDMLEDYQDTSDRLTAKKPGVLSCLPVAHKKIVVANRMKSMREELRKISKDFRDFKFSEGRTCTSLEQHDDDRETSSRLPEEPIIGRNREKQEIINLLSAGTNNDETVIVSIHGLGGMGKSTLAQLIYNDAQFKKYDHRIWVYVSRDFSLKKIGSSIISLIPIEGGQQNRDTLEAINQCLDNLLRGKKVLIVLDDLWEEKDNELGKLRSMLQVGKKGTTIDVIVTTRKEDIARKVSTCTPYKLQPLNDNTCWEIIKRYSRFEDQHYQERLEKIGLDIAKKCGGVALAAQALGYMLQSKDLSGWTEINNSDIWNESSEDNGGVLPSLKLSYERMQPQLRICFSYCAIFPKGHNIAKDDLIHQWIALGFIKPSKGKEYTRQLLGMSFLQVSKLPKTSGDHMERYTMHDLVHDLATLIMGDELIVSNVASKNNKTNSQKYCRYASVTKYDNTTKLSNVLPSKVRALHFSDSSKLDLSCGAFSFAKCLRILDFSGCSGILLPASIGKLKQLKYLTASQMQNDVLPEFMTELSKLQYLNLNGSSHISALPESMGKLWCLKYLGLSGCSGISKLPGSFGDLKCMMHLDMSGCSGIRELPDSLGNLTNLHHLDLSECSGVKEIPESLCGLTHLQYLNLSFCRYIGRLAEAIGSLVNLQYLNMSYCGIREFPESFNRLRNLLHLDLTWCSIDKGLAGAFHGLTALQYLDMSHMSCMQNLEKKNLLVTMRNLTNLKVLKLKYFLIEVTAARHNFDVIGTLTNLEHLDLSMNRFEYLPESIGNLKRLHTLNLMNCWFLKSLPESIGCATGLKSVLLDGCQPKVIDQASSLLHYSLTLPLFMVRADDFSAHSNLHVLEGENAIVELRIVSLENVRLLEEAQRLNLLNKQNLLSLKLVWTLYADRHLEDEDLLGQLVPPMSLKDLSLAGYSSPSFPGWIMDISHHLPNLTYIELRDLTICSNLPPLGQLPYLESLVLWNLPKVSKIDGAICSGKGAFLRLAMFKMSRMEGLEEWNTTCLGDDGVEEFMFPMLDVLDVTNCPKLRLKPCPPKCREFKIFDCDNVISSLEEVQTSSHRCNSTPTTTSLVIMFSNHHSFRLFHHFRALQKLHFFGCQNLESLPEGIQQLSSLQTLRLAKCHSISTLPEWLSDISSLKSLVIEGFDSIKSLPACIQHLTNLEELVIEGNQELQQWCKSEENKAKLAHINIMYRQ
ncbi:putative disease resistance protein RGA1 [Setaria italica]|nr:putative disease resistance protein RGA1 [Setaria italica]